MEKGYASPEEAIVLAPCRYLRFRAPEEELPRCRAYRFEINDTEGNTPGEIAELKKEFLGLGRRYFDQDFYKPVCAKDAKEKACWPMTTRQSANVGGFLPVSDILQLAMRIPDCKEKEIGTAEVFADYFVKRLDLENPEERPSYG